MKKYIFLIIGILLVLTYLSNMPYQQQTIIPELRDVLKEQPLYELLSKIEVTYWGETISVETRGYYYFVEFLIRKGFHFVGYGCISIIFYLFYRKFKRKYPVIYAVFTAFIIACLDELHQRYIAGRTGVFDDVLLDTAGAIIFVFLFKIGLTILQKMRRREKFK